jgi:hypothetical protein
VLLLQVAIFATMSCARPHFLPERLLHAALANLF